MSRFIPSPEKHRRFPTGLDLPHRRQEWRTASWESSESSGDTVDGRNPKQPLGIYKTLQIRGYLPYQLVSRISSNSIKGLNTHVSFKDFVSRMGKKHQQPSTFVCWSSPKKISYGWTTTMVYQLHSGKLTFWNQRHGGLVQMIFLFNWILGSTCSFSFSREIFPTNKYL